MNYKKKNNTKHLRINETQLVEFSFIFPTLFSNNLVKNGGKKTKNTELETFEKEELHINRSAFIFAIIGIIKIFIQTIL